MKILAASLIVACFAATASGQSAAADMVKQRARRLSDQNNARQGVARPAPAAQPQPPPPPDPVLVATRQNIASLQKDFAGLKSDPAQKPQLLSDLTAAAYGTKPTKDSLSALADHLTTALAGKSLSATQQARLAQDVHAICNSSHLTPAQQQTIFENVYSILQGGGVSSDQAAQIVKDVQKIAAETK
jgi:hypothetical protein